MSKFCQYLKDFTILNRLNILHIKKIASRTPLCRKITIPRRFSKSHSYERSSKMCQISERMKWKKLCSRMLTDATDRWGKKAEENYRLVFWVPPYHVAHLHFLWIQMLIWVTLPERSIKPTIEAIYLFYTTKKSPPLLLRLTDSA